MERGSRLTHCIADDDVDAAECVDRVFDAASAFFHVACILWKPVLSTCVREGYSIQLEVRSQLV